MSARAERRSAMQRARQRAHKAAGLCRCGRQPAPNRKRCESCLRAHVAEETRRYERKKPELLAWHAEYERRPDVRSRKSKRQREAWKADPEGCLTRDRNRAYRLKYGLEPAQVLEMHIAQGGKCAVCARPFTETGGRGKPGLGHVDHCHETGVVRGLLCLRCNMQVGVVESLARKGLLPVIGAYLLRFRNGS
jgi:hypothetical protein